MSRLQNQVGIITGGNSGIGLAVAAALVAEGMAVTIAARNEERLLRAASQLEAQGGRVLAVPTDVAVASQVERMVTRTVSEFGRVDLLVNNAGLYRVGPLVTTSEAEWDAMMAINLKGAFLCTKAALPIMTRQGSGYVVNISSVAGKSGVGGASVYSASKFGMIGLTESLVREAIASNVKATVICPAYVDTPMVAEATVPGVEMIPPEDIGKLVVSLLRLSPNTVIKEIVVERKGWIEV